MMNQLCALHDESTPMFQVKLACVAVVLLLLRPPPPPRCVAFEFGVNHGGAAITQAIASCRMRQFL